MLWLVVRTAHPTFSIAAEDNFEQQLSILRLTAVGAEHLVFAA